MMTLTAPPRSQAIFALRALKSVALADGELHPQERRMIELAFELSGLECKSEEIEEIEEIEPSALAEGLTDPDARKEFVQRLVVLTTLDSEVTADELALVEAYAAALDVDEPGVRALRLLVEGHVYRMMFSLGRRSFARELVGSLWREEGIRGIWRALKAVLHIPDADEAARFEALGELPAGTLGHALYHQFADHGFPYPGQAGGPPSSLLFHDLGHVLAGVDTESRDEMLVCAFQCGYMGEDAMVMYLMIAMLFQLGVEPIARIRGVPADKGVVDVDSFQAAYEQGRSMNRSLIGWDPWPHMHKRVEQVRAELQMSS